MSVDLVIEIYHWPLLIWPVCILFCMFRHCLMLICPCFSFQDWLPSILVGLPIQIMLSLCTRIDLLAILVWLICIFVLYYLVDSQVYCYMTSPTSIATYSFWSSSPSWFYQVRTPGWICSCRHGQCILFCGNIWTSRIAPHSFWSAFPSWLYWAWTPRWINWCRYGQSVFLFFILREYSI